MDNKEWSVKKVGWKWKPSPTSDDESVELRGMAWDLICPAGHALRVYTPFEHFSSPLDLGRQGCNRAYPATFKSN